MSTAAAVLVVDDDPMMVRTLCDVLRSRGFAAVGVASGEAALAAVAERPWDAVVMDVKMTGLSGVETARRLRRSHPRLPVILMSAYSEPETLRAADAEGVERVLPKPFQPAVLMQTLELAIGTPARVLIVDDDATFLQTLGDALRAQRIRTLRARTLGNAIELLRDREPSVVLLDLVLDDASPAASARAIRAAAPSAEIVLYSGNQALLDEVAATLPGENFRAVLRKPSLIDELRRVLHDDDAG